jgi:hypothetical protein
MLRFKRIDSEDAQRRQLLVLGLALLAVAIFGRVALDGAVMPVVLGVLAAIALGAAYVVRGATADVYLAFALVAFLIGRVVSAVVVAVVYLVGIAGLGSLFRFAGMDRLRRDFGECRARATMFVDSPKTDTESFERQS